MTNSKWEALIESILEEARQRPGLEECKLSAHRHKLLLYEKGSFFLPHRDGERLDAMVATLIVALLAAHEGGELVVRHEGREHEVVLTISDPRGRRSGMRNDPVSRISSPGHPPRVS